MYAISLCRPIHDAIEIGSLDLVKLLIDHNADLMVEYGERTAVEFAIDQDQIEIAEYIKGGQSQHVQYIVMHTLECSLCISYIHKYFMLFYHLHVSTWQSFFLKGCCHGI